MSNHPSLLHQETSATLKRNADYLEVLAQRLARTRDTLSATIALAEKWDGQMDTEDSEESAEQFNDLRPLLAVDKDQLEHEIKGLLLQISLVTR